MTEDEMVKTILGELNRQADRNSPGAPWVDDTMPDNVCIDGWVDVVALARAILKGEENGNAC